ncbi:MAG: hypothetical protein ACXVW7_04610 [Trebonia sp.]
MSVMRQWRRPAVVAAGPLAAVLVACGSASSPASAPTAPKPVPYNLYTHCGIDYAHVGNRYYEATSPLSDGSGNPPPGWGNPYQPGILTVISPTQAVFTDKAGHRVVFTLVPSVPGRTTAPVCS